MHLFCEITQVFQSFILVYLHLFFRSVELQVLTPDMKNNVFTIKNLLHEIAPSESYHKVSIISRRWYQRSSIYYSISFVSVERVDVGS